MKWVPKHLDRLFEALLEHLYLVFSSVGIALVISLIVGIWAARRPRSFAVIIIFTGILFAVPSLALFALLIRSWDRSGTRYNRSCRLLADDPDPQYRHGLSGNSA